MFLTLGIETSCDDTAVALLEGSDRVICDLVSSQITDHAPFGGVVPELASRRHQEALIPLVKALFSQTGITPENIDLIAVTAGPGLMGSLLVGVMSAKALAQAWNKPLIGVNHLEGHLYAAILAAAADAGRPWGSAPNPAGDAVPRPRIVSQKIEKTYLSFQAEPEKINNLSNPLTCNPGVRGTGSPAGFGAEPQGLAPPFLCLIVSGGHTEIVAARDYGDYYLLGATRDDAAGEAYDKGAKLLGLGYPGGPEIEAAAREGDLRAFDFPIGLRDSKRVEFSFSGLKTSLRTTVEAIKTAGESLPVADLCASFQRAITESLIIKLELAVRQTGIETIAISGGVAANGHLRAELLDRAARRGWKLFLPAKKHCTDNAAMIAAAGYSNFQRGGRSDLTLTPDPSWSIWGEDTASGDIRPHRMQ